MYQIVSEQFHPLAFRWRKSIGLGFELSQRVDCVPGLESAPVTVFIHVPFADEYYVILKKIFPSFFSLTTKITIVYPYQLRHPDCKFVNFSSFVFPSHSFSEKIHTLLLTQAVFSEILEYSKKKA